MKNPLPVQDTHIKHNSQNLRLRNRQWLECYSNHFSKEVNSVNKREDPLILFFHGFPDTQLSAMPLFNALCDLSNLGRAICLAPQHPLLKNSHQSVREEINSFQLFILQLIHRYDPKQKRPIFVIGHDLGCIHAHELARELKERCKGLILLHGLPPELMLKHLFLAPSGNQWQKSWYMLPFQIPGSELWIKKHKKRLLKNLHKTHGPQNNLSLVKEDYKMPIENMIKIYRHYFTQTISQALKKKISLRYFSSPLALNCSVMGLFSTTDPFVLPPSEDLFQEISLAPTTLRTLKTGHWGHIENAKQYAQAIEIFISRTLSC